MFSARLNEIVLLSAPEFRAAEVAPATVPELFGAGSVGTLTVWNGASDGTVFGAATVNHAFRAWHDSLHLATRIGFTVDEEIELGRRQAELVARLSGDRLATLVWLEVAGQATEFRRTGNFVADQIGFMQRELNRLGVTP